ncbi:glycoprotein-N-acetylgalactosamine 3-beta-galactosyltransferase [Podospora fimiseda]|uniref:N-acetylgalactosaminide beta-1,3-galactosyltransferase n=1 Tax=Podospora fimiseda TaxID=252190 RepID=A0AAN7BVI7_9PEZI|nr:glycoprotein-N-acetylgalactosamine 3-beta-galactosyltransferase [Podospora fimiseda]
MTRLRRKSPEPWQRVGFGPRHSPSSSLPSLTFNLRSTIAMFGRRTTPRIRTLLLLIFFFLFFWVILPYDNVIRLAVRWNLLQLKSSLTSRPREDWVFASRPEFPVDLGEDVLVILKTGYGTRGRVPAWLESLSNRNEFRDIVVIADYEGEEEEFEWRGQKLKVHDMVKRTLEHKTMEGTEGHPRVQKYQSFRDVVQSGNQEEAIRLSRKFGWELDALKFVSGLEFAYDRFPRKKWYLLVDDDTFVVQPSLKPFLAHLDPEEPHYLGNAVGDFKARFAHGGSAVILSQATMQSLIVDNSRSLSSFYLDSLDEIWGDRLLALALIRIGIYLDESFSHLFNGEPPLYSKIRPDRICSPILSFHTLPSPAKMLAVGEHFKNVSKPLFWFDLWDLYGVPPPWWQQAGDATMRENWDHVGSPDEATLTIQNVKNARDCSKDCYRRARTCLAWTWESETGKCHISSWMIVGEKVTGKVSGINLQRARSLENKCILL